ncbi:hypothetical protein KSP35_16155 [Aquihabitans sp. G128]|uniref:TetR/AcrR family transcriptional regulator n=1 Tax=Aquihabitans sp. G128 TaxID=2849779 RepID=UPI001C223DD9|nr:TetR/AcrR family transcriptional regulator [Aquihabitans sp. G128]QXC59898.1 hypothetical protein KSP35_16155 [Aquihabitans sp. G128]
MAGDRATHADRVAAAYELFARERRIANRPGLTVAASAQAIGASRSQFYRYWETTSALAEDLALHRATSDRGWQARVRADDDPDVFAALRRALQHPDAADGATSRAVVAAEPIDAPTHAGLAAWEARGIGWLAERLRGGRPAADVPWTALAAMVTALVDGTLLERGSRVGGSPGPFDEAFATLVADTARALTAYFATHAVAADEPLAPSGPGGSEPRPEGASRLLERMDAAIRAGALPASVTTERRVVNVDRLSRDLSLTSRGVFDIWPSAADFNADLFAESLRRLGMVTDLAAMTAFTESTVTDPSEVAAVLVRVNERLMDLDELQEPLVQLALMDVLDTPDAAGRHAELIQRWSDDNQMRAAAVLQASGRRLVPEVAIADYADLVIGAGLGGWRVCATHRSLVARRCRYLDGDVATMAAALDALTQVCAEPWEAGPAHGSASA